MSRWAPALRVARRTARRHPGRTVLVAALVAAPVLGTAFLDTAYRTANLDPSTRAERAMGGADATLTVSSVSPIAVHGDSFTDGPGAADRDAATVDPAAFLPAGTRLLPRRPDSTLPFVAGDRTTLVRSTELAWTDPAAAGLLAVRSGRLAGAAGELTLSPAVADRLGARVGDEVRPAGLPPQRVVGLAADPGCRSCQLAAGPPGWTGGKAQDPGDYLVDLPAGVAADRTLQEKLAGAGLFLRPRDAVLHPDRWRGPDSGGSSDPTLLAILVLVAGLGLLEVVLLAGTAFAVAARRQLRDSALVLANGGRPADVRRMLLAQGAVLGALGAAAGLVAGVLAVVAGRPLLERLIDQDLGALVLSPRDLALAAVAGVAAGIAAAVVPASSASRVPVVAALAGRLGRPARGRRAPATAATVVAVAGLVLAGLVSWRWSQVRLAGGNSLAYPLGLVAGFGLAMVALTVLAPSLVGLAGRLGGRLSLTGRLALRDAARHRHRTGPAVGAVMVAVAGSVAVAFAVASYDHRDRDAYVAGLPAGWASVYVDPSAGPGYGSEADQLAVIRSAATELPTAGIVPVATAQVPGPPGTYPGSVTALVVPAGCPTGSGGPPYSESSVAVGAPTARLVTGARGDEAAAALTAGRVVVTAPCLLRDGQVRLRVVMPVSMADPAAAPAERTVTVPAVLVPQDVAGARLPQVVIGDATARGLGATGTVNQVVLRTSRMPTAAEEDRARTALGPLAPTLQVERGYGAPYLPGFVALIGGAGLVTLAGVAISVALSAAEGRADLATLAAIGAPARRRRGLAMAQAALVAGLGVGLGLLLGAAIGLTIMSGLDGFPLVLPWATVLVIGVGVPALGVLAVGALTRSRLPMVRRLG
ncbi:MAG TPA: FtsX-like permease family protein [Mycobacteriales bacterium]